MDERIVVQLGERSYPVRLCTDCLAELGEFAAELLEPCRCAILSDENVEPLYGEQAASSLSAAGFEPSPFTIPPGEEQKNLGTFGRLCEQLIEAGLDRTSLLVSLGGGVVGDVGGFVAASYMRGISYLQVPTTLLAQVDSSVGGKTAVNLPEGKNLVGAFYQPCGVFIDSALLRTLPERDLRAGMVEVIKYGIIRDAEFFGWLEEHLDETLSLEGEAVLHAVRRSCEIKAQVVAADERESGLRAILNYGHTLGHALEAVSGYEAFRHGEAIAVGMEVAAALAVRHLGLSRREAERQHRLLKRLGVPVCIPGIPAEELMAALRRDKKARAGTARFILARRIGEARICADVPPKVVQEVLLECGAAP